MLLKVAFMFLITTFIVAKEIIPELNNRGLDKATPSYLYVTSYCYKYKINS